MTAVPLNRGDEAVGVDEADGQRADRHLAEDCAELPGQVQGGSMTSSTKPACEPFTSQLPRRACTPMVPRVWRSERAADRTEPRGMSRWKSAIRTRSTAESTSTPPRPGPPPISVSIHRETLSISL